MKKVIMKTLETDINLKILASIPNNRMNEKNHAIEVQTVDGITTSLIKSYLFKPHSLPLKYKVIPKLLIMTVINKVI